MPLTWCNQRKRLRRENFAIYMRGNALRDQVNGNYFKITFVAP